MSAVAPSRNGRSNNTETTGATSKSAARRRAPRPGSKRERSLFESGFRLIAGVDEVGRGAWAGPLSVGIAVLRAPVARMPKGLRDSKQILESERERLFEKVASWCTAWAVGHASPNECDRLGMTCSLRLATRRAFAELPEDLLPDAVVLDGKFDFVSLPAVPSPELDLRFDDFVAPPDLDGGLPEGFEPIVHTVVKADASCVSVAAASVLAKVTRDRIMRANADSYPPYDFDRNKGYPSPSHKRALRGYGLSAIHRRTWVYVENLPWSDPDSSRLRRRLLREPEDSLADDVVEDLVGPAGDPHAWDAENELTPGERSPLT